MLALCLIKVGMWCRQADCEGEQVMDEKVGRRGDRLVIMCRVLSDAGERSGFVARVVGLEDGDTDQGEAYED